MGSLQTILKGPWQPDTQKIVLADWSQDFGHLLLIEPSDGSPAAKTSWTAFL